MREMVMLNSTLSAREQVETIVAAVDEHTQGAPMADDVTIVALRRLAYRPRAITGANRRP